MASNAMRIVIALLTLVTIGMLFGALLQLAFIRNMEDSYGTALPSLRTFGSQNSGDNHLPSVVSSWENDKEAAILRIGYVKPEIVSWSPRIILFHNFLSSAECDYLRAIAKPRLHVSTVVDAKTGKGVKSNVRTSSGMFLNHEERKHPMIHAIEKRIATYSQIPAENGELIQVLRYEPNQFYRPHHDYFSDTFNLKRGGQRVATMLMYLTDNVEGGETFFPKAVSGECSCGGKMVKGLCVKPNKGDAVLFWSMGLDGESDPDSIHGGCEVLSGEKWSATKWMRQKATS
ncbi:prolyl 4-hydroxylase 1 [Rutidosis leptorrhynchoides]|uniref:prolyl 4-hydroxylase 1 n=1 Tax=Rutidosis leptorrhynchoides TaxID=125765 RepID=UPI003A994438